MWHQRGRGNDIVNAKSSRESTGRRVGHSHEFFGRTSVTEREKIPDGEIGREGAVLKVPCCGPGMCLLQGLFLFAGKLLAHSRLHEGKFIFSCITLVERESGTPGLYTNVRFIASQPGRLGAVGDFHDQCKDIPQS